MREDCETVYDYLNLVAGVREEDIIVFGRSMGSGPTSYLSSLKTPYCIVLMSPFMSIKDATKDLFTTLGGMMSKVVQERFRNIDYIAKARCPCFIMHGMQDTLIPFEHSVQLNMVCPNLCFMNLVPDMDHNKFRLVEDLVKPLQKFMKQLDD